MAQDEFTFAAILDSCRKFMTMDLAHPALFVLEEDASTTSFSLLFLLE
jgi:hypothetical protein